MKVLIISAEVWQERANGGNVLSNIFDNMNWEFAQIYCNPGVPCNKICKKYYQMTDSMVLRNLFTHRPIGKKIEFNHFDDMNYESRMSVSDAPEKANKKFYGFFHKYRWGVFFALRHMAWNASNWKNDKLRTFVDEFEPDIIFAPCYGDKFMLRLTRYLAEHTGKKVISYISDDSYTLRQFSLSPWFWFKRFIVRHELRKTFPYYSLVYTMTEAQLQQCKKDFGANMKILLKTTVFEQHEKSKEVNTPIRMVYAGGIYLQRWKTLKCIAEALKRINSDNVKIRLDIYTANEISSRVERHLNDGRNSFLHECVTQGELAQIYQKSDIALHVESFGLKNRLLVRMSFSTKIVDCLSSGCAVMAICDEKQGGYQYLKSEDAAICINSLQHVERTIRRLTEHPVLISVYQEKAQKCCDINHNRERIHNMIKDDFETLVMS